MELALSVGLLAVVSWLIWRAARQQKLLPTVEPVSSLPSSLLLPRVSVVVPARNEQLNIERCINGLLEQDYPIERLNIKVIDDHSTDSTYAIASAIAARSSHVTVVRSPALPPDWVGKSHACWIGSQVAQTEDEWLCFIDADVEAEPELLASATEVALSQHLDLLSLAPRLRLESFAERLVIPCGLYLIAFCQDLAAVQSQRSDKVTATGQFMLVRRHVYESVGGHAAVCGAICEDVALALLIKRGGGRVMLQDGKFLLSARMYTGWSSLWTGISKNLVEMLGGERATLITAAIAIVVSWACVVIPWLDALSCAHGISGSCIALVPALVGSLAALGLHIAGSLYFQIPFWYGLLFPFGYSVGACLAVESMRRRRRRRIIWKGRAYPK
jgi:chlorobactene glucosyltransferase